MVDTDYPTGAALVYCCFVDSAFVLLVCIGLVLKVAGVI